MISLSLPWWSLRHLTFEESSRLRPHVIQDDFGGCAGLHQLHAGHDEDRGVRLLAGDKPVELHVVPVPLDAVQLGVQLVVALQLHGLPHLDQGGDLHVLVDEDCEGERELAQQSCQQHPACLTVTSCNVWCAGNHEARPTLKLITASAGGNLRTESCLPGDTEWPPVTTDHHQASSGPATTFNI